MESIKSLKDQKNNDLLLLHNRIEELKSEKSRLEGAKQQLISEIKITDPDFDENSLNETNEAFVLKTKIDDNIKKMNQLVNTFEKNIN